jgi:AcrR family transcriptional regulator
MTQSGLLHHFRSKRELLAAVMDEREELDTAREIHGGLMSLEEALPLEVGRLQENQGKVGHVGEVFTAISGEAMSYDHPGRKHVQFRYQRIRETWNERFARSQELGTVRRDVDPVAIVPLIAAVMDGLELQWLLDESVDMTASFAAFSQLMLGALENPRTASASRSQTGASADGGFVSTRARGGRISTSQDPK